MTTQRLPLALTALLGLALPTACGPGGETTGSTGDPSAVTVTVTPGPAELLTCSTTPFTATVKGTEDTGVTWSVEPTPDGGSVDEKGVYTAPIQVPASGGATLTATSDADASAHGTAAITLATAHPKDLGQVSTNEIHAVNVWDHAVASSGQRAYAVWSGGVADGEYFTYVARSDDGGATWGAPVKVNDNDGYYATECSAVAVDAGDPETVYVTYRIVVGGGYGTVASINQATGITSGSTLAFAVSKDGGKTFTNRVLYSGTNGYGICPDIASPAAGKVAVVSPANTLSTDIEQRLIDLWVDESSGAGFATGTGDDSSYTADGRLSTLNTLGEPGHGPFFDVGENGYPAFPRVFSDGKGKICVTYTGIYVAPDPATTRVYVQCSDDLGKTFTAPLALDPKDDENSPEPAHPIGAIGPNGEIAVVWYQDTSPGGDTSGVFLSRSTDGKTFSAPVAVNQYVTPNKADHGTQAAIRWEGSILWLTYLASDLNTERLVIDKSCDGGVTWSGAQIAVGKEGDELPHLAFPGLFAAGDSNAMRLFSFGSTEDNPYLYVTALEP